MFSSPFTRFDRIGTIRSKREGLYLLYVTACFGYELGGAWGASIPLALFALAEAVIIIRVFRSSP
jgi:hypothetical protein